MIGSEQAARIACSFIAAYYKGFVEDLSSLVEFYGEQSSTSFARFGEAVATTSQGKTEVRQYLERLNAELGPRKVQIRNADFVPTADGAIAVTVSGQLFTKRLRQVFSQTFVLSPTKYRDNTMYIAGDSLRFISQEAESIPANAVIVAPGEELIHDAPAVEQQVRPPRERKERAPRVKKDEAAAAPVAEVKPIVPPAAAVAAAIPAAAATGEKPKRERRERKEHKDQVDTKAPVAQPVVVPPTNNVAASAAPAKRPDRKKRDTDVSASAAAAAPAVSAPAAAAAAPAAAASSDAKAEGAEKPKQLTSKVRLFKVPKDVLLSQVKTSAARYGRVVDALWFGASSADAVLVFSKPEEARAFMVDREYVIAENVKVRRSYFFDDAKSN